MAACAEPPQTKDSSHPPVVWAHILLSIVPANAGSRTAPEHISALPVSHFLADFSFDYSLLWRIVAFAIKAD